MNTLKKLFAVLGIVLILSGIATSVVSAGQGDGFVPVTLCHGSPTGAGGSGPANQYELITVDNQGQLNGHNGHPNDIIPAPEGGCPVIETPCEAPNVLINGVCTAPTEPPVECEAPNVLINGVCTAPTEPPVECEAPNVLINGVCTAPTEPPVECEAPNVLINGVCTAPTEPPVECEAPNVLINGVCTAPTEPPVVVTPPPGHKDVPTCEEMVKMTPEEFKSWGNRWLVAECSAKGYQTGSGDNNLGLILGGLGAALIALGFVLPSGKKIKLVD